MAYSYNIEEVPPDDVPCVEHDIRRAKKFLQKHSPESGDSLYDHLTEVLAKILAERPKNAVDIFEEFSRKVKEERFKTQSNHLRDVYVAPAQYEDAKEIIKLFKNVQSIYEDKGEKLETEEEEEEGDIKNKIPNMLDLLFYFEQTGVGLPRGQMVLLNLSIRKLMAESPIENVRFWGKVLGSPKNYYVVEADLQTEELNRRLERMAEEEKQRREEERTRAEEMAIAEREAAENMEREATEETEGVAEATEEKEPEGLKLVFPPLPTHSWVPPTEVPSERIGTGANTKVYFVCNEPGLDKWIELPPVTPQQIVIARQIVRYCTGNLETPFHTFPPFPGTEKNYLRAQIARISATTQVSPIGFFTFGAGDEEEELMEEVEEGGELSENVHYDPLPIKDLIDPSMSNWCHHAPYLLKQGRVVWWNPKAAQEEEIGEEEEVGEEEEEETRAGPEAEVGPPLLTPLSEDAIVDSIIPWRVLQSSHVQLDQAVALIRSNIWPGAFAFACGRRFANVYIGWGHKYITYNYSPPSMPPVQDQYIIGPEIMEIQDPTFEQEEAYRISQMPPPPVIPMGEEEEEGVEEEEEEEEEED
ncbi:radial spoke head protein 6 homolog A [Bombus vosnesenskii]|uniref:Radial spoke head protein 6 homolog A n=2 Tax=Pyrobombus TaxID=144703 RepID=A0A6J3KUB3_9HYME|nr:radial spoke head protein 6 homolog A [Bombus vancouverensis nearcticus]XP_033305795.1 radial spoke head protein 6 homolog A [Bombus bifarius]XP_033355731.1 radial spoke head protein 6 homolog A [Bombus vosnesenskii]